MIAVLALCAPPLLLICVRNNALDLQMSKEKSVISYFLAALALNWVMMLILYAAFQNSGNLFAKLNGHLGFACKYIALACLIAVGEPLAERLIRNRFRISVSAPCCLPQFHHWRLCAVIYSAILFLMNFIRIFDNNFWGDEAFTVNLMQYGVPEIIKRTASDVHPPLYYFFVKLAYAVFGKQGWAFHLVSLIPCTVIIIFALTAVWKKFGRETAIILITLQCLSANAIKFNVEVRMYSWGGLFILLSFYYFCCILERKRARNYICFVLFSLAAAYTHYYCLVSVAFLYLALLGLAVAKYKTELKKVIFTCIVTIVGYLPWFFIMLKSMLDRADSYWIISIPTFRESARCLFSEQFPTWLWYAMGIGFAFFIAYETGALVIRRDADGRFSAALDFNSARFSDHIIFVSAGILSVIGTIGFAIGISNLVRPFYDLRYIYPVSVLAWLILGIVISRLKGRSVYVIALTLCLLRIFIPVYLQTYTSEKAANEKLAITLEATGEIEAEDIILTNHSHINWTIASCYYPGVKHQRVTLSDMPELDQDTVYWLIISGKQELDATFKALAEQGFIYETVIEDGNLGTHTVYIYKLVYAPEEARE